MIHRASVVKMVMSQIIFLCSEKATHWLRTCCASRSAGSHLHFEDLTSFRQCLCAFILLWPVLRFKIVTCSLNSSRSSWRGNLKRLDYSFHFFVCDWVVLLFSTCTLCSQIISCPVSSYTTLCRYLIENNSVAEYFVQSLLWRPWEQMENEWAKLSGNCLESDSDVYNNKL